MALPSKNISATDLEFGKLHRVSPEECEAALLFSVADRIKAGASAAELAHWRKVMLTVEIQFECLPTADELYFRAVNIRRSIIVQNEALVRSAMQQIQEIMEYKLRKETSLGKSLDCASLHKLWNDSTLQISSAYVDEISIGWLEAGLRVYKKVLMDKENRNVVTWMVTGQFDGRVVFFLWVVALSFCPWVEACYPIATLDLGPFPAAMVICENQHPSCIS